MASFFERFRLLLWALAAAVIGFYIYGLILGLYGPLELWPAQWGLNSLAGPDEQLAASSTPSVISRRRWTSCLQAASRGFTVIGPTVRDRAIVYDELDSTADLPAGLTDVQDGGSYRLVRARRRGAVRPQRRAQLVEEPPVPARADAVAGPHAEADGELRYEEEAERAAALRVHRRALVRPARDRDPGPRLHGGRLRRPRLRGPPRATRSSSRSTAGRPAARASASRWTPGPKRDRRLRPGAHRAARRRRPPLRRRGGQRARAPRCSPSSSARRRRGRPSGRGRARAGASARARWAARSTPTGIRDLLYRNAEHPRWDEVADRCLTCGNCTMVCPTCFCSTVEDVTDLAGEEAERTRLWDSCFTLEHSYIHGGSVRELGALALPPVDDAQARDLDRPVRHLGLRRLRPLHHLVPGGDRHHRGGGGDPRDRPRPTRCEGDQCDD